MAAGAGEYYAVNVPLRDGIDDATYEGLFRPVIDKIMAVYQPEAVVFQCGEHLEFQQHPRSCNVEPLTPQHVHKACTTASRQGAETGLLLLAVRSAGCR